MGKSSRRKQEQRRSGRARPVAGPTFVARPFAGLPGEADWVALREVVPAATAVVGLAEPFRRPAEGDVPAVDSVTVATVLPLAWPALRRSDGEVYVGLQTAGGSGDDSRDVAAARRRGAAGGARRGARCARGAARSAGRRAPAAGRPRPVRPLVGAGARG